MPGSSETPPGPARFGRGWRGLLAAALAGTVVACVPRSIPTRTVPSDPDARPPTIARVLAEDPPLPGEDTAAWAGLETQPLPPTSTVGRVTPPSVHGDEDTTAEVDTILGQPLTPDSALRLALLNNRELRASLLEVGVARGQLQQSSLLPNPGFFLEMGAHGEKRSWTTNSVGIEYDLTAALLAPLRMSAASAEFDAARFQVAGRVIETGYLVRAAFFSAQAAQQRLTIAHQALDAFAASRDAARALFAAGNVPQIDVDTQEAAYEAARITVAQLELEWLDRQEELQQVLGLAGKQTGWTIREALPVLPAKLSLPDLAETKAIQASVELAETKQRLEVLARQAGLTRTEGWLPDVAVEVSGEHEETGWRAGAGLRFTLPVLNRKQGLAAAQEAAFDALLQRYEGQAIDIRSRLRMVRNRVQSTHAQASQFRHVIVPARARVLDQALLQYNAMQIGVFQLLQARRELLNTELAAVDAQRDYWIASAALDALLSGRRVGTSVSSTTSVAAESSSGGGH